MLGVCRAVLRVSATGGQARRLHSALSVGNTRSNAEVPAVLAILGSTSTPVLPPRRHLPNDDVVQLTQMTSGLRLRTDVTKPQVYKLPTVIQNTTLKKTILDPVTTPRLYDLPCHTLLDIEKVTPPVERIQPVADPGLVPGRPVVRKETMPYLINIRHKKMKKHKLKKFRKRMIFLHRKLNEIKKKRKEKAIVAIERGFATSAREFDAEKYVEGHIKEAKRGAWKTDVIQKWKSSKPSSQTANSQNEG